jgi:hypothetical protein
VADVGFVLVSLVAVAPVLLESIAMWRAPQVLAHLAFVPLRAERRIALPPTPRVPAEDPGYRDDALVPTAGRVPPLHLGRVELTDALLVSSRTGTSFGLRRFYLGRTTVGRRAVWLVRIDARMEGEELVFRAKQAVSPLTLPIFFAIGALVVPVAASTSTFMLVSMVLVSAAMWVVPFVFSRPSRDVAIREAFDVLERELRNTFTASDAAAAQPRDQPPSQP